MDPLNNNQPANIMVTATVHASVWKLKKYRVVRESSSATKGLLQKTKS